MIVIISIVPTILNILQNSRSGWIPGNKSLHQTTWNHPDTTETKQNIKDNRRSLNHYINI